jgi:hypothetical protein
MKRTAGKRLPIASEAEDGLPVMQAISRSIDRNTASAGLGLSRAGETEARPTGRHPAATAGSLAAGAGGS